MKTLDITADVDFFIDEIAAPITHAELQWNNQRHEITIHPQKVVEATAKTFRVIFRGTGSSQSDLSEQMLRLPCKCVDTIPKFASHLHLIHHDHWKIERIAQLIEERQSRQNQ